MAATAPDSLSVTETAILGVLARSRGRVLGRVSIMRLADIDHCAVRRCDTAIVSLRRVLGANAIMTVRRRGWMLTDEGFDRARELFGDLFDAAA